MAVIALNIDSAAQIYEKKTFVKIFTPIASPSHSFSRPRAVGPSHRLHEYLSPTASTSSPPAYVAPSVFSAPGSGSRSCRGCPRRPMSPPPSSRPRAVALGLVEVAPAGLCRPLRLLGPGQWLSVL